MPLDEALQIKDALEYVLMKYVVSGCQMADSRLRGLIHLTPFLLSAGPPFWFEPRWRVFLILLKGGPATKLNWYRGLVETDRAVVVQDLRAANVQPRQQSPLLLVARTSETRVVESVVYWWLPLSAVPGPGFKSRRPDQTFQRVTVTVLPWFYRLESNRSPNGSTPTTGANPIPN